MIELKNNAGSSLAVGITAAETEIQVLSADAPRFPALEFAGDVFAARLRDNAGNAEYVLATARNGNRITVERGQEGTTALAFAAGSSFELMVTGAAWDRLAENRWIRPRDAARNVLTPKWVDETSFTIPGDMTAEFEQYRALRLTQANSGCGFVASAAFAGGVTAVVVRDWPLDTGLTLVELGMEPSASPLYPKAQQALRADDADKLGGNTLPVILSTAREGLLGETGDGSRLTGRLAATARILNHAMNGGF